ASGQLPPGLALVNGNIAGVPTQAGAYTFALKATNAGASTLHTYLLRVSPAVSSGYDSRVNSVVVARDVFPSAANCNHTGYLTYGIADLWLHHSVADADNKP